MAELIKTRKQYLETLDFLKINRFAYDEANEIDALIEALREVAREAHQANEWAKKMAKWYTYVPLDNALDALPDWIKEDG